MSHMDKSCHIRISHVTYGSVMSHMDMSCHIWISYVTYETGTNIWGFHGRVMSRMNE